MDVILVPFAERLDLTDECIALINEEWPRSETARRLSLERSSNHDPPMAFVLLNTENNTLVGFARFLRILNYSGNAALFETILIRKELRGKGLGRILMELLREEAKCRGYHLVG